MCNHDEYMERSGEEFEAMDNARWVAYFESLTDHECGPVQINIKGDNHAPINL